MSRHAVDKAPCPSLESTAGYVVLAEGSTRSLLPCDFGARFDAEAPTRKLDESDWQ